MEALYDLSTLKEISRGNETFIKSLVSLFCEQTPQMVNEMVEAYQHHDKVQIAHIAHKLKPTLDSLNILSLKNIIRKIESAHKEQLEDESLLELLQHTQIVIQKIVSQLKDEYPD